MPWIAVASHAGMMAALNSDVLHEMTAADRYLQLAEFVKQWRNPNIYRQIAVCASTALSNATALAAEMMALGGVPPHSSSAMPGPLPPVASIGGPLIDARAEVAHYQGRLVLAGRLGMLRLQEVFREIVLSKQRHLAHADVIASACLMRRGSN